jgi:hypothetical protein
LVHDFDEKSLNFDEMRLIEEILSKADDRLKEEINSNIKSFIEVIKTNSA